VPDIGAFHPQIVHFVVALLFVGVILRVLSLIPLGTRLAFMGPAAALLILIGTGAAYLAVHSGLDAHGPVERVPGSREAVQEHEDAAQWAKNVFLVVAVLEAGALALGKRKWAYGVRVASAVVGVVGLAALYKAAERGGDLVYDYAGGIGLRSGDTADVRRLLVAGLYHNIQQDRAAEKLDDAARLTDELLRLIPADDGARLLGIESTIRDRKDGRAALAALGQIAVAPDNRRLRIRVGVLQAEAYVLVGSTDSARALLEPLAREFPTSGSVRDALVKLR
jgi:uncharacterized membrane protein